MKDDNFCVFIVNLEQISHVVLVFPLLTLVNEFDFDTNQVLSRDSLVL